MTTEQAIRHIEHHMKHHGIGEGRHIFIGEALNMAIDALEDKQETDELVWSMCPECNGLNKQIWHYCPFCGRPKTWEAKEELKRRINGEKVD